MNKITLEDSVFKAASAQSLLDNPILKEAFSKVRAYLDDKEIEVKTTDTESCKDIIRTKQILSYLESAIYTMINDGKIARKHLDLLTQQKTSIFRR